MIRNTALRCSRRGFLQFPEALRKAPNLDLARRQAYRVATVHYGRCPHHRVGFAWNHCPDADLHWDHLEFWGIRPALRTALSCPIDGDAALVKTLPGHHRQFIFLTDEERDAAIAHLKAQLLAVASRVARTITRSPGQPGPSS